jgi:hypothetical protein
VAVRSREMAALSQPSVWTPATNPWLEELEAERQGTGGRPRAAPSFWQRLLAWLTEYHRY